MKKHRYNAYVYGRRNGYNANLFRNTKRKRIAGVCSGLADHFGISHWVMRIMFVGAFFMTGGAFFWAYILGWVVLAPAEHPVHANINEYDENTKRYRDKNMFRYRESPSTRVQKAQSRLEETTKKIENIECYISSRNYKLKAEFKNL